MRTNLLSTKEIDLGLARKKPNRVDDLLDELLADGKSLVDILGESDLMKQIKKRLVECALAGEPVDHLKTKAADDSNAPSSRDGSSKKSGQSEDGALEFAIPRDRTGALNRFPSSSISVRSQVSTRRSSLSTPQS